MAMMKNIHRCSIVLVLLLGTTVAKSHRRKRINKKWEARDAKRGWKSKEPKRNKEKKRNLRHMRGCSLPPCLAALAINLSSLCTRFTCGQGRRFNFSLSLLSLPVLGLKDASREETFFPLLHSLQCFSFGIFLQRNRCAALLNAISLVFALAEF